MIDSLPNKSIAGRPVKLTVYDTEGNSAKAAQYFRRGAENDDALVIVGPTTTGESFAVYPSQTNSRYLCSAMLRAKPSPSR